MATGFEIPRLGAVFFRSTTVTSQGIPVETLCVQIGKGPMDYIQIARLEMPLQGPYTFMLISSVRWDSEPDEVSWDAVTTREPSHDDLRLYLTHARGCSRQELIDWLAALRATVMPAEYKPAVIPRRLFEALYVPPQGTMFMREVNDFSTEQRRIVIDLCYQHGPNPGDALNIGRIHQNRTFEPCTPTPVELESRNSQVINRPMENSWLRDVFDIFYQGMSFTKWMATLEKCEKIPLQVLLQFRFLGAEEECKRQ